MLERCKHTFKSWSAPLTHLSSCIDVNGTTHVNTAKGGRIRSNLYWVHFLCKPAEFMCKVWVPESQKISISSSFQEYKHIYFSLFIDLWTGRENTCAYKLKTKTILQSKWLLWQNIFKGTLGESNQNKLSITSALAVCQTSPSSEQPLETFLTSSIKFISLFLFWRKHNL